MPTRAARRTWVCILTCCRVITRLPEAVNSIASGRVPQTAGLDFLGMVEAGKGGKLKALYVVGSNPIGRVGH